MSSSFQLNSAHTLDASERNVNHISWIPASTVPEFDRNAVHQIFTELEEGWKLHQTFNLPHLLTSHAPPPPPPPCHVIRKWKIWVCNMKLGCLLQELIVFWEMTSCRHFGETLCFRSQIASETLGKKTPLQGWGVVTFQKTGPSLTTVTYSNTKFWPCDSSSICCKKTEAVHNVVLHIAGQANVRVMQSWGAFA